MFGKDPLALSLFTLSASTTNWLACLLSLSRGLELRSYVSSWSRMIHMLQFEEEY